MLGLLPHLPQKNEFRVANSGHSARFATREVLAQLKCGSQLLIFVANVGIMLYLPHKFQRCVANSGGSTKFSTQEVLAQLEIGCQLLICVANSGHSTKFATQEVLAQLKTGSQPPILVANVGSTVPFATQIPKTCGKQRWQCQICHTRSAGPAEDWSGKSTCKLSAKMKCGKC